MAKTTSSSIPGAIHGSDAAVMMMICDKLGYVTGIHDSAGVHPNDTPELKVAIAETLYECNKSDYFQDIADQVGYKVKPPVVNTLLDPEIIKESLYAFC